MYDNTLKCEAHYYIDDSGYELSREEFMATLAYEHATDKCHSGPKGYMVYLGSGFVPLVIAVLAANDSDAMDAVESWCEKSNRLDEINRGPDADEENWGEYEYNIEPLQAPLVLMRAELCNK